MNATTRHGDGTTTEDQIEQVRARIRAAGSAAEQARRSAAAATQLELDTELLRRRLPVTAAAARRASRSDGAVAGLTPVRAWLAARGRLATERDRRRAEAQSTQAEHWALASRIAEQEARARALRAEVTRLRSAAATLPRLLDEAAAVLRRNGGQGGDLLAAAEGGLEPVLRRESNLDQAVRWAQWAQVHVGSALDPLGSAWTCTDHRQYLDEDQSPGGLHGDPRTSERVTAARLALAAVRDVFDVLGRALADLGVSLDGVSVPDVPGDLGAWFDHLESDSDGAVRQLIVEALARCEKAAFQLTTLHSRLVADHAATRRVLESRRALWCSILRGG